MFQMALSGLFNSFMASCTTDVANTLLIFTTVLLFVKSVMWYKENEMLPPGPWGIPFLGHITLLGKNPLATLENYRKQYGDIYRLRFGGWPVVVISGRDAIKTALHHSRDAFNDRPELLTVTEVAGMKGVAFCHFDPRHVLLRKIAASALKMCTGSRNKTFDEITENEAEKLVDEMMSHKGKPFDPHDSLYFAAGSIIFQITFGKGKNLRGDKEFSWVLRNTMKFNNFVIAQNPLNVIPWMRFILPQKFNSYIPFKEFSNRVEGAIKSKQAGIMETYDRQEIRHVVDALISAANQYTDEEKTDVKLTNEQILGATGDFIGAGFDTTATTLKWGMLFLASNPIVQEKVQKELDETVGLSRRPSILDRPKLHFTEAVVLEILRMASTAPLLLPHSTCTDAELFGYVIPKNTIVLLNVFFSNFDPQLWNSPHEFKPERFLDEDGKVDREKAENVLTFGAGRRRCIGEQLARNNLFVFLTFILQRCKIIKSPEESYNFEGELTLIYVPHAFKIKVVERI